MFTDVFFSRIPHENISQTEPFLLLLPCDYFSPSPLVIGIFVLAQIDSIYANMSSFKGSYVIGFRYVSHYSCVEDSRYKCITGITIRSNMFGLIYSFDSWNLCYSVNTIQLSFNREGGYVSVKLEFNGGDINNLGIMIQFLRDGGGELLTDKVYIKLGKIGEWLNLTSIIHVSSF